MPPTAEKLLLHQRVVGPWHLNSYVIVCPDTRHSLLIDPGDEPRELINMIGQTQPQAIIVTHSHPDHIGALNAMQKQLAVPVMAFSGSSLPQISHPLQHGDTISLGRSQLRVYHTPGHTSDQICLGFEKDTRFVVGDTIFEGGPGNTRSTEAFKQTLATLRNIILDWPDEAVCYPGHGPWFRLGDQRKAIRSFLEKDHGGFYGDATWEM
jgi:glyoxylase-like metal-dependent hydrolase (beta-lactamase superfamily II)